jgi:tryptophanyl-tRNA synthetase
LRERRAILAENPAAVWDILHDGAKRARTIAEATMVEVRKAVGLPE